MTNIMEDSWGRMMLGVSSAVRPLPHIYQISNQNLQGRSADSSAAECDCAPPMGQCLYRPHFVRTNTRPSIVSPPTGGQHISTQWCVCLYGKKYFLSSIKTPHPRQGRRHRELYYNWDKTKLCSVWTSLLNIMLMMLISLQRNIFHSK